MKKKRSPKKAIDKGISFLLGSQNPSGSFGYTVSGEPQVGVFPSALILYALSSSRTLLENKKVRSIVMRAAKFLLREKSPNWSWNYELRSNRKRYPDDLDDTSCALLALERSNALKIDGGILAAYVKNLLAAEIEPGGPYATWISNNKSWRDIDTAVNANIGTFLGERGVFTERLDSYLLRACKTIDIKSLYYKSPFLPLYFLSRYLATKCKQGKSEPEAQNSLLSFLRSRPCSNSLEASLQISSLANLNSSRMAPQTSLRLIYDSQKRDGGWDGCPMYIEEKREGATAFASSREVSTAFSLEALSTLSEPKKDSKRRSEDEELIKSVLKTAEKHFQSLDSITRKKVQAIIQNLDAKGLLAFVICSPCHFHNSFGEKRIKKESIESLCYASLLGWIGYTVQDDIVDEKNNTDLLPFSNICLRESASIFSRNVPKLGTYVSRVFDEMDKANQREASCALRQASGSYALPKEIKLMKGDLAKKSYGFALGPLAIASLNGVRENSQKFRALESFFLNYLFARQLNDDAHDWEKDLKSGRLNGASAMLLNEHPSYKGKNASEKVIALLKKDFWEKSIVSVAQSIENHSRAARKNAAKAGLSEIYADALVSPLERSARKALSERDKTQEFIKAYSS